MERNQDNVQVQLKACNALWNLAVNNANHVTLMAAEAHVHIIRAMGRHQDDAQMQGNAAFGLLRRRRRLAQPQLGSAVCAAAHELRNAAVWAAAALGRAVCPTGPWTSVRARARVATARRVGAAAATARQQRSSSAATAWVAHRSGAAL